MAMALALATFMQVLPIQQSLIAIRQWRVT